MANNQPFKIIVGLTDLFSKPLDGLTKKLKAMQAPFKRLGASFGKFADVTGLKRLNEGMKAFVGYIGNAFRSLAQMVPIFGALTGAGMIAALQKMISTFADFGTQLSNTAVMAGTTPQKLQLLENAFRLVGISAGTTDSAVASFGQTLLKTQLGGDSSFASKLAAMGLNAQELAKEFSQDPAKAMATFSTAVNKTYKDPRQRQSVYEEAGLGGVAPGLQDGGQGLNNALNDAASNGILSPAQIAAAKALKEAIVNVQEAAENFSNVISSKVAPIVDGWLNDMSSWLKDPANQKWISDKVYECFKTLDGYLTDTIAWLKDGHWASFKETITGWVGTVNDIAKAFGGWKVVLEAFGLLVTASLVTRVASLGAALMTLDANPVGLAITAVAALVVGISELIKHWADVSAWFKTNFPTMTSIWTAEFDALKDLVTFFWPVVLKALKAGWALVKAEWTFEFGLLNSIVAAFSTKNLKDDWSSLTAFFKDLWSGIVDIFDGNFTKIQDLVDAVKDALGLGTQETMHVKASGPGEQAAVKDAFTIGSDAGLPPAATAGILGNEKAESSFDPNPKAHPTHFGIFQWSQERADRIKAHFKGMDVTSMDNAQQMRAALWEAQTYYPKLWAKLKAETDPRQAADDWNRIFEVSSGTEAGLAANSKIRGDYAAPYFSQAEAAARQSAPATGPSTLGLPWQQSTSGTAPPATTVHVHIPNAPPGTKVTATSKNMPPPRISTSIVAGVG